MPFRLMRFLCLLFPLAATPVLAQQDSVFPPLHAVDRANFDTTCAPCRDFFGYVNGGWLARTTIPPQYSITGVDRDIQDRTEALLHRILDKAARDAKNTTDADTRRIGLFYGSCMDSVRVDREGTKPLGSRLGRIAAIRSRAQLVGVIAELEREGVDGPIAYFAYPNFKNSRVMSFHLYQGGLGLPDRDFYLRGDSEFTAIRREYTAHVGRMLTLLGSPKDSAEADARRIVALETAIARTSIPAQDARGIQPSLPPHGAGKLAANGA